MKIRNAGVWCASVVLLLAITPSAWAGHSLVHDLCFEDIVVVIEEAPPIVVGCEIIDCCPGCPGPGPLDWRIRFTGDPIDTILFEFQNLSPEAVRGLEITGNAKWTDDNLLQIGRGEAFLRGFAADPKQPPVVAIPRVVIDKAGIQKFIQTAEREDLGHLELLVEQMVGTVVVNEFKLIYRLRRCFWPPPPPILPLEHDHIDLHHNRGDDNAVLLLDGRRSSGCVNDEIWRGNNIVNVGNVLSHGPCNSEVAVFSDDDAMQLIAPIRIWTDATGDRLTIDLTHPPRRGMPFPNLVPVPVTVWIMRGTFAFTQVRAVQDLARANFLYNTMNGGITFQTTAINNATVNPNTPGLVDARCGQAANLRTQIGFTTGQLNVYYLRNPGARGWWCGNNTIIVGAGADNESLSHEFGHAFSLRHVNVGIPAVSVDYNGDGVADFPNTNVMWGGSVGRNSFSEGQCFRMNINLNSTLNTNGERVGPTRNCPDPAISPTCPWSGLDAVPN